MSRALQAVGFAVFMGAAMTLGVALARKTFYFQGDEDGRKRQRTSKVSLKMVWIFAAILAVVAFILLTLVAR